MILSENLVRHIYVLDEDHTAEVKTVGTPVEEVYISYNGAGGPLRSDLINIKNITYAKATDAKFLRKPLRTVKASVAEGITLENNTRYILSITVRQFVTLSDEDTYEISASAVYKGNEEDFWKAIEENFIANTSRDYSKLFAFEAEADGINITEYPQEWVRGVKQVEPVYFEVFSNTSAPGLNGIAWAAIEDTTPAPADTVTGDGTYIGDGYNIADVEYFLMGERGDMYRNIGWPKVIPTTYLVDPASEYHTLDIHYFLTEDGISVQKSEKDVLIVAKATPAGTTAINTIIAAINTAVGDPNFIATL